MSSSPRPTKAAIRTELRALLVIGGPLVVNNLFTICMQAADTVMAGWLGAADLAAVAIGGNIWTPLLLLCIGTLTILSAVTAQSAGAGRDRAIGPALRQGLWIGLGLGVLLMAGMRACDPVLDLLGLEPRVRELSRGYLDAISWGGVGICLYMVLRFVVEGFGRTAPIMLISGVGLMVNVWLNWVLMFGKYGLPRLGAVGCGWATAITLWLMAGAMAAYVARGPLRARIDAFGCWERPEWARIRALLRLGLPAGGSLFLEASLFGVVGLMMGWMGTQVVAAHQIALNYAAIMFMVPLGLAFATTVRVGGAAGRGDAAGVRLAGWTGICAAVGFMTVSAAGMIVFGDAIVGLYTRDAEVIAIAAGLVLVAAAFQVFDGAQVAASAALRGLSDTRVPMLITVAAYWAAGFPLAVVLGFTLEMGPQAVWVGLVLGLAVAALLLGWRFARVSRRAPRPFATAHHEPPEPA